MKVPKILTSRTVWTVIALFIINGVTGIREFITPSFLPVVDGILGIAVIYFRVKPRVNFSE